MILNRIENFYSENGYKVSYLFDQCSILLASTFLHRVRIPTLLKTYYPSFLRNIRNKDSPQPLLKWTYYRHKKKFPIYYPSISINLKKERKKISNSPARPWRTPSANWGQPTSWYRPRSTSGPRAVLPTTEDTSKRPPTR